MIGIRNKNKSKGFIINTTLQLTWILLFPCAHRGRGHFLSTGVHVPTRCRGQLPTRVHGYTICRYVRYGMICNVRDNSLQEYKRPNLTNKKKKKNERVFAWVCQHGQYVVGIMLFKK